jgi:hypothetical protein
MSSSGSASYATTATNYGKNANDSYYVLGAPGQIAGNLNVGGNLTVQGSTTLVGPTTAGNVTMTGGSSSGPLSLNSGGVLASPATFAANIQCGRVSFVSGGTIGPLAVVTHPGVTQDSIIFAQVGNNIDAPGGFLKPQGILSVIMFQGSFQIYSSGFYDAPGYVSWYIAHF